MARRLPHHPWLAACVVAAAAVAAYANTLTLGFTLDDFTLIVDNPRIGDPAWLLSLFTKPLLWRPLKRLTLAADWWVWGLAHPAGFHATNIALHAATCVALWAVAIRLGLRRGAALAGALLFALHPVHVEAVANISHRKEPMALLFSLLAFLAYLRGREADPRPGPIVRALGRLGVAPRASLARAEWVAAAAVAYLCGMLSKEVGAVMLPCAVVVHELFVTRDAPRVRRARLAAFVPALGAVVLLFTVRGYIGTLTTRFRPEQIRWVTGEKASEYGSIARIATKALGESTGLLVVPWPLYFDRAFEIPASYVDPGVLLGLAVAIGFLAALVASLRRFPLVFFLLAWFVLFLLPVSGAVPLTYWHVAERFLYAPSAGIALLAGVAADRAWNIHRAGTRRLARGALVVLLASFAGMTITQNRVWHDQESLYAHTLVHNPRSYRSLYGLGLVREKQGELSAAAELYERSMRVAPDYGEPYYALALLRLSAGRRDEAIALAESAAQWMNDPGPLVLVGNAWMESEHYAQAVDAYRRAHERDPKDADVLFNLGNALEAAGDLEGALRAFDDAIALDPTGPDALAARAAVREKLGRRP